MDAEKVIEKAGEVTGNALSGFGMLLFIVNCVFAVMLLIKLLNANLMGTRGTNVVTRFVRDSRAFRKYSKTIKMACVLEIAFLPFIMVTAAWYALLPTAAVIVFAFIFKYASNASKKRKESARTITKGTVKAVATAAPVAAAAAALPVAGAATAIAAGIGTGIAAHAVSKSADEMKDVKVYSMGEGGMNEALDSTVRVANKLATTKEELVAAARRMGIKTDNRSENEIASDIVRYSPQAMLEQFPAGMSDVEKAKRIVEGAVQ